MALDLTSLRRSIEALDRSWAVAQSGAGLSAMEKDLAETIRAGVIQHFEVAYELCWKLMKRWLELNVGSASTATRQQLYRLSAESGLIADVDEWMDFHRSRNETTHIYDEGTAEEVFRAAGSFLHAAKAFLAAIEARND